MDRLNKTSMRQTTKRARDYSQSRNTEYDIIKYNEINAESIKEYC